MVAELGTTLVAAGCGGTTFKAEAGTSPRNQAANASNRPVRGGAIFASSQNHHFQPAFLSASLVPEPVAELPDPNRQTMMKNRPKNHPAAALLSWLRIQGNPRFQRILLVITGEQKTK